MLAGIHVAGLSGNHRDEARLYKPDDQNSDLLNELIPVYKIQEILKRNKSLWSRIEAAEQDEDDDSSASSATGLK
jgi:hypothetical protein